jgi:hypothetical protein
VGATKDPALGDLVTFGHKVLDGDIEIGEALAVRETQVIGPLPTSLLAPQLGIGLLVVDTVRGKELVVPREPSSGCLESRTVS